MTARARETAVAAIAMVRADAPLYLFILVYTLVGVAILDLQGAANQAAYSVYVGKWLMLFAVFFPAMALILDTAVLLHRFDRRRDLAARRIFSRHRLARLLSGMALLLAMLLFQGTFTSLKNVLPLWQGGFLYDRAQADIDKLLHFGIDPWRLLYGAVGEHDWIRTLIELNYNLLWFALTFGALFYVATSPRAEGIRARYLFAFMLVWIVVGNVLAGLFISAGPCFYGLVTGDNVRFAEMIAFLARGQASANSAAAYQEYLWTLHAVGQPGLGSGISAFPSVHVGLAMLNALFLAEYSRRWAFTALAYVAFIIASSVYLGWHYAIDGYIAVAAVVLIHFVVRKAEMLLATGKVEMAGQTDTARPITAS